MRRLGYSLLLPALALLGAALIGGCRSSFPNDGTHNSNGASGPTITAQSWANGLDGVRLDSSLVTTHRRMLGLAIYDSASGPDVRTLAPDTWFIGVTFRYDEPGPELRLPITDASTTHRRDVCRVRVVHSDADGRAITETVTGGVMSVRRWVEDNGLIIRMDGTLIVELEGGRQISTDFQAPVQGLYLAP